MGLTVLLRQPAGRCVLWWDRGLSCAGGQEREAACEFLRKRQRCGFLLDAGVVEGRRRAGSISCFLAGGGSGTSSLRLRFEHMAEEEEGRRQAEQRLRRQPREQRRAPLQVSQGCPAVSSGTHDTGFSPEPCSSMSFCLVS